MAHDLRAPLRSISGFVKILNEDYADKLDEQGRDCLTRIFNGSERMGQLIADLLRLSSFSRKPIDGMDIDLSALASSLLFNLDQASPDGKVETIIAEGLRAYASPNLMKIVLANLFENAWKFTSKTSSARIEFCSLREGKTVFYVKDNGAGFEIPTMRERCSFLSEVPWRTRIRRGAASVWRSSAVIRRHSGKIWAEGEPGKGATFYFTL